MVNNGNNGVLLIATKQSQTEMIKTGGIVMPSPKVNRSRVETTCKYIVACEESQGNAFLIGEIDRVLWVNEQCVIKISGYALLDKPGIWQECGNKYNFGYLANPSQMHLYVGRIKFKSIFNSIYTNGNGANGNGKIAAAAASVDTSETKKQSAIVTYPKPRNAVTQESKPAVVSTLDRIAQLKQELAELEQKAMLHDLIDALPESKIGEAILLLGNLVK